MVVSAPRAGSQTIRGLICNRISDFLRGEKTGLHFVSSRPKYKAPTRNDHIILNGLDFGSIQPVGLIKPRHAVNGGVCIGAAEAEGSGSEGSG